VDDARVAHLERAAVALDQAAGQHALGLADRAPGGAVELHRQVGDAAGGDVGGDVDLAAPDDAEVDDRCRGGRVEVGVHRREAVALERAISSSDGSSSSIQPRNCQMARKSSMSLMSGVPVRAMSSGRDVRHRMRSDSSSTCCERCEVLFLMKCASSTTIPRKPNVPNQPTCRSSTS
jgi:hypothetical protein